VRKITKPHRLHGQFPRWTNGLSPLRIAESPSWELAGLLPKRPLLRWIWMASPITKHVFFFSVARHWEAWQGIRRWPVLERRSFNFLFFFCKIHLVDIIPSFHMLICDSMFFHVIPKISWRFILQPPQVWKFSPRIPKKDKAMRRHCLSSCLRWRLCTGDSHFWLSSYGLSTGFLNVQWNSLWTPAVWNFLLAFTLFKSQKT